MVLAAAAVVVAFHPAPSGGRMVVGLLILAALSVATSLYLAGMSPGTRPPFAIPWGFTTVGACALALVAAGVLLQSGLSPRGPAPGALLVSGALLLAMLATLYWLMVWDSTYDPIGIIWLVFLILCAILVGSALVFSLPGRMRLAGLMFALIVPVSLIGVTAGAQRASFRTRTAARAEHVGRAIEAYYGREGHYPESLEQLVPRELIFLPGPVIIFGQTWCYEGGGDSFRLGYVDREHWSDPRLAGRLAMAKGDTSLSLAICAAEIDELIGRYPDYFVVAGE